MDTVVFVVCGAVLVAGLLVGLLDRLAARSAAPAQAKRRATIPHEDWQREVAEECRRHRIRLITESDGSGRVDWWTTFMAATMQAVSEDRVVEVAYLLDGIAGLSRALGLDGRTIVVQDGVRQLSEQERATIARMEWNLAKGGRANE